MADKKESDQSFTKGKGVAVEAVKNIPLRMCVSDESEIPQHLRRHPGGVRVERGTTINVTKEIGERLVGLGYAKTLAVLLAALVLALLAFAPRQAEAQTVLTTSQAAVTVQEGPGYIVYSATVDTVGTDTFHTPAFAIGGLDKTCATTCLNLLLEAWAVDETGTEDVNIAVHYSSDIGQPSNWNVVSTDVIDNLTTTVVSDTLSTVAGAVPAVFRTARWVRISVAGQSGNPADSDVNLRIYAVKPAGLGNVLVGQAVNNGS